MIGVAAGVATSVLIMFVMGLGNRVARPPREPRRRFDLAPEWLGPGFAGVGRHRAAPCAGRDWLIW